MQANGSKPLSAVSPVVLRRDLYLGSAEYRYLVG